MPELPDVEVFRRHVAATSLHREIETTSIGDDRVLEGLTPQLLQRRLKHARFERTHRHGKYLLVELAGEEDWLVLHFGMSGYPRHLAAGRPPPDHTRVEFRFGDGSRLAYVSVRMLGKVFLVGGPERLVERKQLGPDALRIDRKAFTQRLAGRRGYLKTALMDQSLIAGVGNVYSDEVLFQTGLHPKAKTAALGDERLRDVYRALQRVLETTIRHHADPAGLPRGYLLPHREGDGTCPRCGGELEKLKVGSRHAVYCPRCQPKD